MAYSVQVLREAKRRLQEEQRQRTAEMERQRQAAYAAQPRLRTLDHQLRATMAKVMAAAFQRREDPAQALTRAKEENQAAQMERRTLLAQLLLPDYLDLDAPCPDCGGSGYQGQTMCHCLRSHCRAVQMAQFDTLPGENRPGFDSFRLDVYYGTAQYDLMPREQMRRVLDDCWEWAETFGANSPSLLLTGGTGLGKTLMSACLGRTLTARDVGVTYVRVGDLLRAYEAAQFGGEERPRQFEEVELLILDDLGTEMTTQFTNSVLYSLLDGRLSVGRPTVISTNLPAATLQQRYPPQLISRLLGAYETLIFFGDDLRMR